MKIMIPRSLVSKCPDLSIYTVFCAQAVLCPMILRPRVLRAAAVAMLVRVELSQILEESGQGADFDECRKQKGR